jgi:hypothetical protein
VVTIPATVECYFRSFPSFFTIVASFPMHTRGSDESSMQNKSSLGGRFRDLPLVTRHPLRSSLSDAITCPSSRFYVQVNRTLSGSNPRRTLSSQSGSAQVVVVGVVETHLELGNWQAFFIYLPGNPIDSNRAPKRGSLRNVSISAATFSHTTPNPRSSRALSNQRNASPLFPSPAYTCAKSYGGT